MKLGFRQICLLASVILMATSSLACYNEAFDKAQLSTNRDEAISLYRDGLAICPDDDVAHYELGRALAGSGRQAEAENAFEAALKINPDFTDARRQLEAIRKNR